MTVKQTQFFYSIIFYLISAFGISLTIISQIGVSSFNALNLAIAQELTMKVGTITIFINLLFLLACWLLDKHRKVKDYLVIVLALILFGTVVNFFVYYMFSGLFISTYGIRMLLFIAGVIIAGFGTGQVLRLKTLRFPIEHFCLLLSEMTHQKFSVYRYSIDVVCVIGSLGLTSLFHLPLFVREGTIISLILLSYMINLSKNLSVKGVYMKLISRFTKKS